MTFMLDMAVNDLGELEASYDESDKLAFRLVSTYANVLMEITDLTNLQQIALKSQGAVSDSTFQLALDISQPILAGIVIVNGIEYVINLEPNTGTLVIPEICEVEIMGQLVHYGPTRPSLGLQDIIPLDNLTVAEA